MEGKSPWMIYILECSDGTLYTGVAKDMDKRLKTHQKGSASKYTRGRLPVKVAYLEAALNKSQALKRELQIKKLSRPDKLDLIKEPGPM